ncbi:MAG TPA: histidine triad nucleotide-binding protein [bacterium]|jgi:histidine triad (HIT) family protein|nr:histidine triad nucleotide-binding protein [bacterium]
MSNDCLFCKIIRREIPAKIAFEDDQVLAFHDIQPAAPVHILFVPKKHVDSVADVSVEEPVVSLLADRAVKAAKQLGIQSGGFRLLMNYGPNAGQTVHHLHMHLLGGAPLAHL